MREGTLDEVRKLVAGGKMIEAIKRIREETKLSLKEAKLAAEALQRGETVPSLLAEPAPAGVRISLQALEQVKRLAEEGKHVEAIKSLRDATNLGLREAKEAVEAIEQGRPVPQLSLSLAESLPSKCPSCGAVIATSSLRWVTAVTAECLYCGAMLRPGG